MAMQQERWISIEEYHEIEQNSDIKYEYSDGHIYALSGGTFEHSEIAVNLSIALGTHLRGKTCKVVNSDMKVLPLSTENPSYFPDITVTCNPEDYKRGSTAIRSPRLIFEVLSPSTTYRDRGEKLRVYKTCPSMEEYVMVSTRRQEVEVYRRVNANIWENTRYGAEEEVTLASVGLTIPVSEIYADTDIPPYTPLLAAD
jgi:Uma2 family endonuclease